MELRQLEYFQMASRLRNITRAAERLRVSQPNITVAIKKLEAELGIQLFDRSQKQLALTPEGAVFLNRVELALRNIQDAVLEVNDYKQLQKGTIKIGVPPMMGAYLFPRIFSSFQRRYSHLDIFMHEEASMSIREQLERDELDFGIIILYGASNRLQLLPMSKNQIVCCVPESSPLAKKKAGDAFARYIQAEIELTSEEVLAEPVTLLAHEDIERAAQAEREARVQTLAAESAGSFYPLASNHAKIDTLLTEMGY